MNKTGRIALISVFLFILCPAAHAWYQVEVIVFKHVQPDTDGEKWYANPGLPDRTYAVELVTDAPEVMAASETTGEKPLVPFQALGSNSYRLEGIYRVLKLSREYRPLFHASWQQPALSDTSSRPVHLEAFNESASIVKELPPELAAIQIPGEAYEPLDLLFDGTVRVRSTRFLHVDVDVAYFPEAMPGARPPAGGEPETPAAGYTSQQAQYVRLKESRKIKLNELHYFDHPLFGVIIQVSRLHTEVGEQD